MTAVTCAAATHWLATFCDRSADEAQAPVPVWYEAVMWVAMGAAEREEFLADVRVGVLSAAMGTVGQTLAVPVWYSYQPGGLLTVLTGRRSRKAAAIRAAGRFGLCVQDASPPYRYVNVEGPVVSEEELDPAERLAMARRYLGAAGGDRYVADNPDPGRENVAFRMRPEHWLSQDQGKG
jgi:Pyridoxamine 5'-phosphate oxidase